MGSCDQWEFPPFFKGHWQSPCTALKMPDISAVQGDCEILQSNCIKPCCAELISGNKFKFLYCLLYNSTSRATSYNYTVKDNDTHGNIKIYFHFLSFFNTQMAQVVQFPCGRWGPLFVHSQYHGCWWPGDARSQDISSHCIGLVCPDDSSFSTRRVNVLIIWNKNYQSIFQIHHARLFWLKLYE